jgi:type IV pilus assembly protein PilW
MNRQHGFSLVELMVGLAIGIVVLTVLSLLLVNNSRARVDLDQSMQQIENGRYAMDLLNKQLQHAGFNGEGDPGFTTPLAIPDPCATDLVSLNNALAIPVQGFSQVAAATVPCIGAANVVPGTDVIILRRAQTLSTSAGSLDPNAYYIQTVGNKYVFNTGADAAAFNLTQKSGALAPIHQYSVHIYFVSPCSTAASGSCAVSDDGGTPIPTLKRLELVNGDWQVTPLSEGIDRVHFEYGVDNSGRDGSADLITSAPATITDMMNVVEVRTHILSRNTLPARDYLDNKTYNLGAVVVATPNDNFKRHVYTGATRLMNISARRE